MGGFPPIELIFLDPIPRGRCALGPTLGPELPEGVGPAGKSSQHGGCVMMADPAFVFAIGHIQGVMGAVFNAPALLVQGRPLPGILLGRRAGSDLPGVVEFPLAAHVPINRIRIAMRIHPLAVTRPAAVRAGCDARRAKAGLASSSHRILTRQIMQKYIYRRHSLWQSRRF